MRVPWPFVRRSHSQEFLPVTRAGGAPVDGSRSERDPPFGLRDFVSPCVHVFVNSALGASPPHPYLPDEVNCTR